MVPISIIFKRQSIIPIGICYCQIYCSNSYSRFSYSILLYTNVCTWVTITFSPVHVQVGYNIWIENWIYEISGIISLINCRCDAAMVVLWCGEWWLRSCGSSKTIILFMSPIFIDYFTYNLFDFVVSMC